ncbi:MAG: 50S ribosomal protein L10 [Elusimicrobiota bacterium]
MKLTKEQKTVKAKDLAETLKGATHLYFTQYQGLKFQELAELRGKLQHVGSSYRVIKNSVLKHALKQAGIKIGDDSVLSGPNALLFGAGDDPVSPARILVKFDKELEPLRLRGGVVDGQWLSEAELRRLSTLGTKPEVLTQLACALYASVAQSAGVLAAPIRDMVLVLKALEEKKKSEAAA